jgi:hypothetical protein
VDLVLGLSMFCPNSKAHACVVTTLNCEASAALIYFRRGTSCRAIYRPVYSLGLILYCRSLEVRIDVGDDDARGDADARLQRHTLNRLRSVQGIEDR